jgi:hypothetical protein
MADARVEMDIDHEMAVIGLELLHVVTRQAEILAESVRDTIPLSDIPSAAGGPPHSSGPLRDSWQFGRAKIRNNRITAYAYSTLRTEGLNVPLAIILDQGLGRVAPRPFIDAAIARARPKIEAETQTMMRGG